MKSVRTYVYKLTSDRGGAPCAPPSVVGEAALLTLSICKPAIRRTAQVGDRLLGLTSRALVLREGYPACAVIYAARVASAIDFGGYSAEASGFERRPDCIYRLDAGTGALRHTGRTRLHAEPAYAARDVGRAPLYRNARTLVCEDFRYLARTLCRFLRDGRLCGGWQRVLGRGTGYLRQGMRRAWS